MNNSEWKEYKLGEVTDSCLGKMLDAKKNKGMPQPYLANVNVRWGSFDLDNLPLMRFEDDENERYGLKYGDIVLCEGGEPGRCAIWKNQIPNMKIQKALHRIRCHENLDYQYLYYYLLWAGKRGLLEAYFTGTTIKHLPGDKLKIIPIKVPSIATQKEIAKILSALDDKIELNNAINRNLEEQAQALFKNWFIDFAPFGGKMPEDWKEIPLKECCSAITDGVHNTVVDDPNGDFYLLSCKNIKGGLLSIGTDERRISKETFNKLRRRTKLAKGDILLSSVGTVGEMLLLNRSPDNIEFQRSVAIIRANLDIVSPHFLYNSLISQKESIVNAAHGAVQQCIFLSDIGDFKTILPAEEYMEKYTDLVVPYFNEITKNQDECQYLKAIRDAMLPKLMSGEIDADKIAV